MLKSGAGKIPAGQFLNCPNAHKPVGLSGKAYGRRGIRLSDSSVGNAANAKGLVKVHPLAVGVRCTKYASGEAAPFNVADC